MPVAAPIPGQSLTDEPKNYPWERPPQIVDFNEATKYHIDRLADVEVMDNVLFALEYGIPSGVLVESMMTGAVAKGIHNIDVGLIVSPVVHEFVKSIADEAGINYKQEFEQDEVDPVERAAILIRKSLKATPDKQRDAGYDMLEEMADDMEGAADDMPETKEEDMPQEEPASTGLMSRM